MIYQGESGFRVRCGLPIAEPDLFGSRGTFRRVL